MPPPYELMVYANVTDLNATDDVHFFAYLPDDPLMLGVRPSAGPQAGQWLSAASQPSFVISPSLDPYFPEYNGLSGWSSGPGFFTLEADVISDYSILDISAAPAAGTPVSNIWTLHLHVAMDQPPSPYAVPPTVVTLTPHLDPLGMNHYIDVSAEARFSPDPRLPIMWYRWFTGGVLHPDGSITPPDAEITDYADVPLGPRRRSFTYGPVPDGTYQFACSVSEPIFGAYNNVMSEFATIALGSGGYWTVRQPTQGKVAVGRSQSGVVRVGRRSS